MTNEHWGFINIGLEGFDGDLKTFTKITEFFSLRYNQGYRMGNWLSFSHTYYKKAQLKEMI